MRRDLKRVAPELALERLIEALAAELIEATDEEILEAAKDLGMDPRMKGSAAFIGIRYPGRHEIGDFFASWGAPPGRALSAAQEPRPAAIRRVTRPYLKPRKGRTRD